MDGKFYRAKRFGLAFYLLSTTQALESGKVARKQRGKHVMETRKVKGKIAKKKKRKIPKKKSRNLFNDIFKKMCLFYTCISVNIINQNQIFLHWVEYNPVSFLGSDRAPNIQ